MVDAPLIITPEVTARLHRLRDFAASRPVDMPPLMEAIKSPDGMRRHKKRMNAQTVRIDGPWPFFVTFSIETNHPGGTMRHMSMSIMREDRAPHPAGVWMVAEELGFSGGLDACQVWLEDLSDGGKAVNVVQPLAVMDPSNA
jgi:hypothetical protein